MISDKKERPDCLHNLIRENRRGMTLVEVIVSLALLAIVVIVLSSAMLAGLNVLKVNMPRTNKSLNVAGNVDNANVAGGGTTTNGNVAVQGANGNVTITLGGNTGTVNGVYQNGDDTTDPSIKYWSFNPN